MKLLTKHAVLAFTIIGISGCAMLPVSKPYKNKSLSNDKIAMLRPTIENSTWVPGISEIMNKSRDIETPRWRSIGNSFIGGYPQRMNLLPGRYEIIFYCANGNSYAFPRAKVVVEEGKIYSTRCFNAVDDQVGVEVIESNINNVKM
ncbi:hypothetical protein J8L98_10785 [Pseudoalteromonas sp. MMG013]|uniref:hypothetical protein n=1 Tax=Pseudoalteromonas sp. MMG013 TaxID=2822687 RepID=UPI001B39A611|nr:hypothetical protein [Pseudoalteromonas sp. MMG013]MBQ4862173.1 hypothetical protein [Pseudoalteromonas sp. MMG013]